MLHDRTLFAQLPILCLQISRNASRRVILDEILCALNRFELVTTRQNVTCCITLYRMTLHRSYGFKNIYRKYFVVKVKSSFHGVLFFEDHVIQRPIKNENPTIMHYAKYGAFRKPPSQIQGRFAKYKVQDSISTQT